MILPFAVFVEKERVGVWAIVGTVVSLGGAAAMFLI
jgi:drug/metabolite transporter (DMT)-like permease